MTPKPKIIAIGGVTASGKTDLSIHLAKLFNGEIVNCDSRQIYKKLDIGTAKETPEKRHRDGSVLIKGIRHYLVDQIEPNEEYSLAKFQKDALKAIDSILLKKKLPILVGGTGLYLDAVIFNYDLDEQEIDETLRSELKGKTVSELQEILREKDTGRFTSLTPSDQKNPHRLIRSIEKTMSENRAPSESNGDVQENESDFNCLYLVFTLETEALSKRITQRVDAMFDNGLLEENQALRKEGLSSKHSSMKSIGYREFDAFFARTQTLSETKDLIKLHTRQYARRQRTWFKRNKDCHWIKSLKEADDLTRKFLTEST